MFLSYPIQGVHSRRGPGTKIIVQGPGKKPPLGGIAGPRSPILLLPSIWGNQPSPKPGRPQNLIINRYNRKKMKTIAKTIGMCLFAASLFLSSCSKDDDQGAPEGTGSLACSFKVDLEGQQTLPNTYGQDKIILTSGEAELLGMEYFGLQIVQSKGGDSGESVTLTSFIKA